MHPNNNPVNFSNMNSCAFQYRDRSNSFMSEAVNHFIEPPFQDDLILCSREDLISKNLHKENNSGSKGHHHNETSASKHAVGESHGRFKKTFHEFFGDEPQNVAPYLPPVKKEKQEDVYLTDLNNSEEERRPGGAKRKINVKNTYIKKINSLIVIDQCREYHSEIRKLNDIDKEFEESDDSFKGRNRQSAKSSRKRKKIYMELLEKKVAGLRKELNDTISLIERKNNQNAELENNLNKIHNMRYAKTHFLTEIKKSMKNNNEGSLIHLLEDYERKIGVNGGIRKDVIKFLFTQIFEHILPLSMKNLLINSKIDAGNAKGTEANDKSRPKLNEVLAASFELKADQEAAFSKDLVKLREIKKNFDENLGKLHEVCSKLLLENSNFEANLRELKAILNPQQYAKFLLLLDNDHSISKNKLLSSINPKEPSPEELFISKNIQVKNE